jgi:3'-phosphoadenosine 5'-phosphosulfate sulfotransferase (PAPS reductase)/FAD synthetase
MSVVRHILSISGGKDSAALAIYMRDRQPNMEYVFCDTQKELKETYEYLAKLEGYLGKKIERLNAERGFDHWLQIYGGYLPSPRMRWCTRQLKLKPFEEYVGEDDVVSYIGIRADEAREGYISTKPNIRPRYPFKEDGLVKADVLRILEASGIGLPSYYRWRSRSGCYFCFFQQKSEWVGLLETHPDKFEEAKQYEKVNPATGERYTWSQGESLDELSRPERIDEIKQRRLRVLNSQPPEPNRSLMQVFATDDDEDEERACLICEL